jgi:hypothetical protein
MALQWLKIVDLDVEIDLYNDDYIDFKDFAGLADHWREDARQP